MLDTIVEPKYWAIGEYIGDEFIDSFGEEILIGNDYINNGYCIKFIYDGSEYDNIFFEEINFINDLL